MTPHTTEPKLPTLLVVDDQPLNIQILTHIFAPDHTVLSATSGAQALALCAGQLPDLVLLDVMMPDMGGHEVCRRLKADTRTQDIPIIFITVQSDPHEVLTACCWALWISSSSRSMLPWCAHGCKPT